MPAAYSVAALKSDIRSGPLAAALAPLVTARNDAGVAAAYNAVDGTRTALVAIPSVWALQWCALSGVRRRIEVAAGDPTNSACDAALAVRDYWWGVGTQGPFDLPSAEIQALLDSLAAASVTIGGVSTPILAADVGAGGSPPTPGSKADLMTWGTVPCSYAESAWSPPSFINQDEVVTRGTVVSAADVSAALNGA